MNKRLNAVISIGGAVAAGLKNSLTDTTGRIGKVGDALRKLQREQRTLSDGINTFGRMGKNVDGLRAKYAAVTGEIEKQRRELERLQRIEQQRQANLSKRAELRGQLGDTVGTAAAIALPVVGATRAASAAQYELQLIANTANMTAAEVEAMGRTIVDASRQTGQSAPQMRQALGFLIAAGMDIQTAQSSLVQIGKTATASGADIEDLARAAFTLTDTLKIKPGKDLQDALDTLAQAGKEGNVELRDMAKVLPVLGSGFQALKMNGREAAASMGAALEIARKGASSADEAANNLQNFVAKLMSPETLNKAQKEFGLDLYKIITDAQARGGNPFEAAIKAISAATGGDQKRIGELFGDMQVQNFIRPMIQNFAEYERIKTKALGADGVTDKDFARTMATAKEQVESAREEVGRLAEAVGGPLAVAFGKIAAVVTPVIRNVTELATQFPNVTAAVLGTVTALTVVRVGMLAFQLGAAVMAPLLAPLATGLRLVGSAAMFMGRMLLLNPIGLAVTGIALAAGLIIANWEPIRSFFTGLWSDVKAGTQAAFDWIMGKINAIGQFWQDLKSTFSFGFSGPATPASAAAAYGGVMPGAAVRQPATPADAAATRFGGRLPGAAVRAPMTPVEAAMARGGGMPQMATARGGAASVVNSNNTTATFNIQQQPGEDARALAKRIDEILRQRQAVSARSTMTDGVTR